MPTNVKDLDHFSVEMLCSIVAIGGISGDEAKAALRVRLGAVAPATPPAAGTEAKRKLSPEGRARIVAAAKRRWAATREANESPSAGKPAPATKKAARKKKK